MDTPKLNVPGFKLYSFGVGLKFSRAFSYHDHVGTILDYLLGECGAEGSPLPRKFFSRISISPSGATAESSNKCRKFFVAVEKAVLNERTRTQQEEFDGPLTVLERAKYLLPAVMSYLNNPNLSYVGFVWTFIKRSTRESTRFQHPAAEYLAKRILKINPKSTDFPAMIDTTYSFRHRLPEGMIKLNKDDFANVNLQFSADSLSDLWAEDESGGTDPEDVTDSAEETGELQRIATVTVDVQHVFLPNRPFSANLLDHHAHYCDTMMNPRVAEILRELKIGEPQEE